MRERYNRGFSLLEVIVALSILTICVTVLMRVFSGAVLATRTTSGYYTALEVAESRLAGLVVERNPLGTGFGETEEGYRWRTRVTEYIPDPDNLLFAGNAYVEFENKFVPYYFQVEVEWGDRRARHLELSTIRLGTIE
ncbi:MAG: general secretion pathway protein GspH [Gammaproteobacteria bacterium]|nr:MAG: general secretion pathway protein GspH [Gammaproteobacteria bacterium]